MKAKSDDVECQSHIVTSNPCFFSLFSEEDPKLLNVLKFIEEQFIEDDFDNVCVVSIIGRSVMNDVQSNANLIGNLIGQNVFLPQINKKASLCEGKFAQIDGYYDAGNRIVFLHLSSTLDSCSLTSTLKDIQKQISEKNFLNLWPNLSIDLVKSLILLFHISHVVIVSNQTPRFDMSCINMFRIIDSLRVKLQPFVTEMLQSIQGLPAHLIKSGRLCVPQLLFTFEALDGFEYINKSNIYYYVKQLEDQISRVLRKCRLIGMSANGLFSISSSNSFVFISTKNVTISNYDSFFFDRIFDRCNNDDDVESHGFNTNYPAKCDQKFFCFLLPHLNATLSNAFDDANVKHNQTSSDLIKALAAFKELIFAQTYPNISGEKSKNLQKIFDSLYSTLDIDNRFSEGRCSKMVMNAVSFYQENLPSHYTREAHERKLRQTLQYFTVQSRGPAIYKYIKVIQNECDKFWNNGRKMCEELSLTGNYCVHKVHRLLHGEMGESLSSGAPIIDGTENGDSTSHKSLPVMLHATMAKIVSACNCGRRQSNREDPFTTKSANYDFYLKMKFKCHTCRHLGQIKFPVYDNFDVENLSSSQNVICKSGENRDSPLMKTMSESAFSQDGTDREGGFGKSSGVFEFAQVQDAALSAENLSNDDPFDSPVDNTEDNYIVTCGTSRQQPAATVDNQDGEQSDARTGEEVDPKDNASFNDKVQLFLSQSTENEEEFDEKQFSSEDDLNSDPDLNHSSDSNNRVIANLDLATLPPMIHTLCTPNLPARFSSWSLVCLGSSSIYSHNLGIQDQQGFINGSHYLLPWNVTVMLQHEKNMPPLWEGKRPPGIKHKKTLKDGTQFTVKIFIGVEYECLRGHRFIACGPDQILKTTSNIFPETANKIATSDMPIYMHCICSRPGKTSTLAQLMRIHIVTPKAPIHVTVYPFVQMTSNASPLFYPGNSEPINLTQSSYWVLRFPMIYEAENGPFCWPKEPMPHCRLLKNCYGIADIVSKVKV